MVEDSLERPYLGVLPRIRDRGSRASDREGRNFFRVGPGKLPLGGHLFAPVRTDRPRWKEMHGGIREGLSLHLYQAPRGPGGRRTGMIGV